MPSLTQTAETFAKQYGEPSPEQAIRKGKATMQDWVDAIDRARTIPTTRTPTTSQDAEERYQQAVKLLSTGNYTCADVATILGISMSTLSTYSNRAINERLLERKRGPKPYKYRKPRS